MDVDKNLTDDSLEHDERAKSDDVEEQGPASGQQAGAAGTEAGASVTDARKR